MNYELTKNCIGRELTRVHSPDCRTLYLIFGDSYAVIRAEQAYDDVALEADGPAPGLPHHGYEMVEAGVLSAAELEAYHESRRREWAASVEEQERRELARLRAKFGE